MVDIVQFRLDFFTSLGFWRRRWLRLRCSRRLLFGLRRLGGSLNSIGIRSCLSLSRLLRRIRHLDLRLSLLQICLGSLLHFQQSILLGLALSIRDRRGSLLRILLFLECLLRAHLARTLVRARLCLDNLRLNEACESSRGIVRLQFFKLVLRFCQFLFLFLLSGNFGRVRLVDDASAVADEL